MIRTEDWPADLDIRAALDMSSPRVKGRPKTHYGRDQRARIAAEMRRKYLSRGRGCKSRLRAILARTGQSFYSLEDRSV